MLEDRSFFRDRLIRAAAWLAAVDPGSQEETALLKTITREINSNPLYLVKLRLVCALARSSSPAAKSIFQHLQRAPSLTTRRAAAIGSGLIKDLSAVPFLISQLNDEFPSNTAACYALGRIGSPRSLEAIAEALLNGTEHLRRAAAESLAQNRSEGHPALREGATREDLLVRYAVVHGLSLIPEDWSLDILDKMRIDEKEWVVRDLAQNSYQALKEVSPYLPQRTPPPEKAPWMLAYAKKGELDVPTPANVLEYLLMALEKGTEEQKQDALAYLGRSGNPEVIPQLLTATREPRFDIAQQAELAIWYLSPPRYQFPR
jgi:HEAT repeat protein